MTFCVFWLARNMLAPPACALRWQPLCCNSTAMACNMWQVVICSGFRGQSRFPGTVEGLHGSWLSGDSNDQAPARSLAEQQACAAPP